MHFSVELAIPLHSEESVVGRRALHGHGMAWCGMASESWRWVRPLL
jgi:hypothetical protein